MVRFISAALIALTVSTSVVPAFAGDRHGGKGGHAMGGHGALSMRGHGHGGFAGLGGKNLAAGVLGLAVGAMVLDALANQ